MTKSMKTFPSYLHFLTWQGYQQNRILLRLTHIKLQTVHHMQLNVNNFNRIGGSDDAKKLL